MTEPHASPSPADLVVALAQVAAEQSHLAARQSALLAQLLAVQTAPRPPAEDELLDMPTVATRLGVPESRARELGRRGELPTVQVGKYVRVRRSAVDAFMRSGSARSVDMVRGSSEGTRRGR